jgi:hypothetical protein
MRITSNDYLGSRNRVLAHDYFRPSGNSGGRCPGRESASIPIGDR